MREQLANVKSLEAVLSHVPLSNEGPPKLITNVLLCRTVTKHISSICTGYPLDKYEFIYLKPPSGDANVFSLTPAGGAAANKQQRFDLASVDAKIGPLLWMKLQNTVYESKVGTENSSAFRILRNCAKACGQDARATLECHKLALRKVQIDPSNN